MGEHKKNSLLKKILEVREVSLVIVIALICITLTVTTDTFLVSNNIFNVLKQVSITIVLACGMTFIIASGGIDLSIAGNMSLGSVICVICMENGMGEVPPMLVAIALCAFVGMVNGILITRLNLPPFIITMGMDNICKGICLVLTEGYQIPLRKGSLVHTIGQGKVWGDIPILVLLIPIVVAVGIFVLNKTVLGNRIKAVGGNEMAARLSGLNTRRLKVTTYLIGGIFAGIAAIMVTGRLNAGHPNAAGTFNMDAIAATIVGGTAMSGGDGTIIGSMLGALLMQLIRNGLVLLKVNMYWQTAVIGLVLIVVCALDSVAKKRTDGGRQ